MVAIPLGTHAYKRAFAGMPEIVLQNRMFEKDPSNLVEGSSLITRPGSNGIASLAGGTLRGNFSKQGLFNNDLFTVSGHNLYRVSSVTGLATQITGTIDGDGFPYVSYMKGIGYEYLFIADGTQLQFYTQHAMGTLTASGAINSGDTIKIGSVYYGWNTNVEAGTPAGTSSNPYWALLSTGDATPDENLADNLTNMAALLNNSGIPGQYSEEVTAASTTVTATSSDTTLVLTAIADDTSGNSIATTVVTGGELSFGSGSLTGGGGSQLYPVTGMGSTETALSLTNVSSYVLISVAGTNKFYWLEPGTVVIDPLNFASKESSPDNILDMLTIGDQGLLMGNGSTENWYATGNFDAPFAPIEGRVYQRGVIQGTAAIVGDSVCLVGNDGVVYLIGYMFGNTSQYGVHRVSDHAIEERIRTQLRVEQGLMP